MTLDLSRMMMRQLNRRKDRRTRKGKPDAGAKIKEADDERLESNDHRLP